MMKRIAIFVLIALAIGAFGVLQFYWGDGTAVAQDEKPTYYVVRYSEVSFTLGADVSQYATFPFPSLPRKAPAVGSIVAPDVFPHVVGYFSVWVKVSGSPLGTFTITAKPVGPAGTVPANGATTLASSATLTSGSWYVYEYNPVTCFGIRVDVSQAGGSNATVTIRLVYQ